MSGSCYLPYVSPLIRESDRVSRCLTTQDRSQGVRKEAILKDRFRLTVRTRGHRALCRGLWHAWWNEWDNQHLCLSLHCKWASLPLKVSAVSYLSRSFVWWGFPLSFTVLITIMICGAHIISQTRRSSAHWWQAWPLSGHRGFCYGCVYWGNLWGSHLSDFNYYHYALSDFMTLQRKCLFPLVSPSRTSLLKVREVLTNVCCSLEHQMLSSVLLDVCICSQDQALYPSTALSCSHSLSLRQIEPSPSTHA